MTDTLAFTVHGTPAPQGSKASMLHKSTGRVVSFDANHDQLTSWRDRVAYAARITRAGGDGFPIGPVHLAVAFYFPRPKHHFRTGINAHLLRTNAPRIHAQKPDADKLLRAVCDALTDAGMWRDDCQAATGSWVKYWANPGEEPGATISLHHRAQPAHPTES